MANDVVRFVDSIAASPTTRLDLNDGTTFTMNAAILAPPPQIHSSISSNAMTDGGYQSSSRYDYRVIHLELILNVATQDAAATALQNLHRELDRETNFLKWQPDGATKPVFFKTWRTSPLQIIDQPAARAVYFVILEIPADPFAYGLREQLGPYTLNNDLAAGSNGGYIDLTGIIGDVEAPCLVHDTTAWRAFGMLAIRTHDTDAMVWWKQAESMTLGTDTTNPGGAADAAMSGSGTTNYVRTSFGTTSLVARVNWDISADVTTSDQRRCLPGTYRVFAFVRRSGTSATMTIQARMGASTATGIVTGTTVTLAASSSRMLVDLGVFGIGTPNMVGFDRIGADGPRAYLTLYASRSGAAETLDWDSVMLVPADEAMLMWADTLTNADLTTFDGLVDGLNERVIDITSVSDPATAYSSLERPTPAMSGAFVTLSPNVTNRVFGQLGSHSNWAVDKTRADSLGFYYWPRYLHVRPATT